MRIPFRRRGFSVIELLIVMAIVVFLATMLLAGYVRFNNKRKVEEAALNFAQFLKTQQKRAVSGDLSVCSTYDVPLTGYLVEVKVPPLHQINATSTAQCGGVSPDVYTLDHESTFEDAFMVLFKTLSFGTVVTDGTVIITRGNYTFTVSVNDHGAITVEST